MPASEPRQIPFDGVRLRFDSEKPFDELVQALLSDVGHEPVMIDDIASTSPTGSRTRKSVETYVGPSGFMLFALFNHGAWIRRPALTERCCG